jgi:hypothetical protein
MEQVHDFSPGIGSNGLFWLIQVPDDAVTITEDTLTIHLTDAPVFDQIRFPGGTDFNLGIAGVSAKASFDITFKKTPGTARRVQPTSADPLSPFNWAGEMWDATNSGTFRVASSDGTIYQGSFSSSGNFGEMGTERNGSFVRHEEHEEAAAGAVLPLPAENSTTLANSPKFKGKIPVESLVH